MLDVVMSSPWKSAQDSPSRELLYELSRQQRFAQESFYEQLDKEASEKQAAYQLSIEAAARQHDAIRRQAEFEHEKFKLEQRHQEELRRQRELVEIENLRRSKAQEELAIENERQANIRAAVENERKVIEQRRATEALEEQARREIEQRRAEEARREKEKQDAAEKRAQEQAEAEAKAKAAARTAAQRALQPIAPAAPTASSGVSPSWPHFLTPTSGRRSSVYALRTDEEREAVHARYMQIHKNLKELRKHVTTELKKLPHLKTFIGETRRTIKLKVGQLVASDDAANKSANNARYFEIVNVITKAQSLDQPMVNYSDYLLQPFPDNMNSQGPILVLFYISCFSKAIIAQWVKESAVSPQLAEPVGICASKLFSNPSFIFNGATLIDILIAKLHSSCGPIFGIYGPESTPQGRKRLGWRKEDGTFVREQQHLDRMNGIGTGYAALALRDFDKAKNPNPYPPFWFWQAMGNITNTPPDQVTPTHLTVLKAMIEGHEERILRFFGANGRTALRWTLIDFPARVAIRDSVAAGALRILPEKLAKDRKLYL